MLIHLCHWDLSMVGIFRSMDNLPNGLTKAEHNLSNGLKKTKHLSTDDPSCSDEISVEESAVESKPDISFQKLLAPSTNQMSSSTTIASSGVNTSESESIFIPSLDASLTASVGAVKQESNADSVVSQDVGGSELSFANKRGALEKKHSFGNGRVHGNLLEVEGTQVPDSLQSAPSSAIVGASSSRPSSNYGNRSQQPSAPMKGIIF